MTLQPDEPQYPDVTPLPEVFVEPEPENEAHLLAAPGLLKRIGAAQRGAQKRPRGRPTAADAASLRDTMMHVALDAFMTRGFDGASLEAIARDAKIGKITIYRQFGTKEALFRQVIGFARQSLREQVCNSITDAPPEQVIRGVITRLVEVVSQPDFLAVLRLTIAEAPRFPDIAAAALKNSDFALGALVDYLADLQCRGVIVIDEPQVAASQLAELATGGVRNLLKPRSTRAAREQTVDTVYTTIARAWGLEPLPPPTVPGARSQGQLKPRWIAVSRAEVAPVSTIGETQFARLSPAAAVRQRRKRRVVDNGACGPPAARPAAHSGA